MPELLQVQQDQWELLLSKRSNLTMGKIRVKTIGDEELEKKDLKKAQARLEAKKAREEAEARRSSAEKLRKKKEETTEIKQDAQQQKNPKLKKPLQKI